MSIELNRIIIPARSKWASATFLASILDVPAGPQRELSVPVKLSNGVTLDYMDAERFNPHHCAFLASEAEFDAAYMRIRSTGITYYAGPHHQRPGEIGHLRGGRSIYFDDPDGHHIEIITRPYHGEDTMLPVAEDQPRVGTLKTLFTAGTRQSPRSAPSDPHGGNMTGSIMRKPALRASVGAELAIAQDGMVVGVAEECGVLAAAGVTTGGV